MEGIKQRYSIVYFLDYGKNFGGANITLIRQAALMKQEGHEVILFLSDYLGKGMQEKYEEVCLEMGIDFQWETYQVTSQTEDVDVICIDRNYETMRNKIASYRPDILHSMQINPSVELISRELCIPHIMNIYPLHPDFFSLEYLDIFPHYHICDSWFYARKWQCYLHTDSVCIRNAVNTDCIRRKRISARSLNFICAGSIYKEKNQLAVIRAFHKALDAGISGKLTLCGYVQGDYGSECIRYIKDHSLQKDIVIKGFCINMDEEYRQNDVLICGSTRESYPNVISEAMAEGLVIISTPVAGVPEVVEDGKNGYLAKDYSAEAFYEKIMEMRNDILSGRIERIADEEEKAFINNHAAQTVKKHLLQYYQYVLYDYKERCADKKNKSVHIEDLRDIFAPWMKKFDSGKQCFSDPVKIAMKLWYLHHIKELIDHANSKKYEFYIWGTGRYGTVVKEMVDVFFPGILLKGFLDSRKTGMYLGYKIYDPKEALPRKDIIVFLAAVNGQEQIVEKLEKNNLVCNKDYFILSARRW